MGLFKKKTDDGGDADRGALFGKRKDKSSPAPKDNPYAQPPANDPYANAPPPYQGGNNSFRDNKSPAVTGPGGPHGGGPRPGPGGGYGSQQGSYGGGYGGDKFGSGGAPPRQGGYGGMGAPGDGTPMKTEDDTDSSREQLFGGAAQRQRPTQPQGPQSGASGAYGGGGGGGGESGGYGAYGDRQLTAEEQEEEDVTATKGEIKFMKQQDVSSTRNALRLAQQAEETGRDTLARLGAQGERIHNTERNLDLASSQNRLAEEKARELKTLNRSMFAVHVSNPFTSSSRAAEKDAKILATHRSEREQRDATRKAAWESSARQDEYSRANQAGSGGQKSTLADRAKYQFEADSDDDEMENEIDTNLDALHGAARRLNHLGRAMGSEVDTQNNHIGRIITKTENVDDQIAMNRARLDRIH
ncbi:hypothetical protein P280DRAFT_438517 [Massarina eburnea CBS 473.64]|uniref:Protein transport protein SEC9 n=1 Tax=Massarina eburnea CBS 473.64 TaxID=1395130 RepID=A0A6A6RKZ4_9PLEO|nr:hypothetical protein P280DRAFT_438517 [Massarina eburnea CBS 473.64]